MEELYQENDPKTKIEKFLEKVFACEVALNLGLERHFDLFYKVLCLKDEELVKRMINKHPPIESFDKLRNKINRDIQLSLKDKTTILSIVNKVFLIN